jgi:hypothetical protein
MEAARSFETLVSYHIATQRHIPVDRYLDLPKASVVYFPEKLRALNTE